MSVQPRQGIEKIKGCTHGGPDYAELALAGIVSEDALDFSVCCNPYLPPPGVLKSLKDIKIGCYPDSDSTKLRQILSRRLSVPPEDIIAGSGTTELIRLIALAYFGSGDNVLVFGPTYGEYRLASEIFGVGVIEHRGREENSFCLSVKEIDDVIRQQKPKGVFICNPNNPTGQYFSRQEVEAMLAACESHLLILDEAYVNFVTEKWSSLDLVKQGNVIILRSMTKDYALAGLRLGYAVACETIINTLRRVCPPWNVNVAAQRAGTAALNSRGYLTRCHRKIKESRDFLVNGLTRLGLPPLPSQANFFLVKVGSGMEFHLALLKHGILVRDCASFGLPEYVRIAPRTMPECRKLLSAIDTLKRS